MHEDDTRCYVQQVASALMTWLTTSCRVGLSRKHNDTPEKPRQHKYDLVQGPMLGILHGLPKAAKEDFTTVSNSEPNFQGV